MTVNDLVGKIAERASALADMGMMSLRREHPDTANAEVPNDHNTRQVTEGMTRGELIADILVEEFSEEFDLQIEEPS